MMLSPFLGMDPFLEEAEVWPGFHADLAIELKRRLNQQIGPRYYADVEIQSEPHDIDLEIASSIRPDVSIFEPLDRVAEPMAETIATVAIPAAPIVRPAPLADRIRAVRVFRTKTREVVTTIELLSPYNKRPGDGLIQYRHKRNLILTSRVHLVEIDLLRGGERPAPELADDPLDTDYVLLVNRFRLDRVSEIWPVALNEPLPLIPVPLLAPDPDIPLDLNDVIREVYTSSRYDWRLIYEPPVPPPALRPAMQAWVDSLLASRASRPT